MPLPLCLALAAIEVPAPLAFDALFFQTSGPETELAHGDWFSAAARRSGGGAAHELLIYVPPETPGSAVLRVFLYDPESAYSWDEVRGAPDATRFVLERPDGKVVTDRVYAPDLATDASYDLLARFPIAAHGTGQYRLLVTTSEDDDNSWRLRVDTDARGVTLAVVRATEQLRVGEPIDRSFWFHVLAGTSYLRLLNFDMDGRGRVRYAGPDGSQFTGMTSRGSAWNAPRQGLLSPWSAGDIVRDPTPGWWRIDVEGLPSDNQFVLWVQNNAGQTLPLVPTGPAQTLGAAIALTPVRQAQIGAPGLVQSYALRVHNRAGVPDVVDFAFASSAGLTWELHSDPDADGVLGDGLLLTDVDGDGRVDTGLLGPDAHLDVIAVALPPLDIPSSVTDTTRLTAVSSAAPGVMAVARLITPFDDSDGDGLFDRVEIEIDSDLSYTDSDGDGLGDGLEAYGARLHPESPLFGAGGLPRDSDGDMRVDPLDTDDDDDTIPSEVEAAQSGLDRDGDGLPSWLDTDSDGDGLPDELEAGPDPYDPEDYDGDEVPEYLQPAPLARQPARAPSPSPVRIAGSTCSAAGGAGLLLAVAALAALVARRRR